MEKLNQKKLDVLVETTAGLNRQVEDICAVRPEVFSINREEWKKQLAEIRGQIHANQMILFIGPFSSGKSSFINALLGEDILPTSNRPCTSVVTELSFVEGGGHRGVAVRKDGQATEREYDYASLLKMVDGPSGAIGESAAYHHIELEFDITQLQYESACLKRWWVRFWLLLQVLWAWRLLQLRQSARYRYILGMRKTRKMNGSGSWTQKSASGWIRCA